MGQQLGQQGTIHGTVESVSPSDGRIAIQSGNNVVSLEAKPDTIASLSPGDDVSLSYKSFEGKPWVISRGTGQAIQPSAGTTQQLTGTVQSLDKSSGTIAVQDLKLRVHPQDVENITPGETVTVSYANVQNVPWVQEIQPVQQQQQQQQRSASVGQGMNPSSQG
jgi:hypothetical protein